MRFQDFCLVFSFCLLAISSCRAADEPDANSSEIDAQELQQPDPLTLVSSREFLKKEILIAARQTETFIYNISWRDCPNSNELKSGDICWAFNSINETEDDKNRYVSESALENVKHASINDNFVRRTGSGGDKVFVVVDPRIEIELTKSSRVGELKIPVVRIDKIELVEGPPFPKCSNADFVGPAVALDFEIGQVFPWAIDHIGSSGLRLGASPTHDGIACFTVFDGMPFVHELDLNFNQ